MNERVYTIANRKPAFPNDLVADLLEDGIAIAKVRRTGGVRTVARFSAKFYTDASRARFEDFCDSISISEGLEAMVGYN